ncbi:MAG: DEAD/DEAH box helicase, partial [Gaiellaceae bacterium]
MDALAARGIQHPFDIQERALPDALRGLDVLVRSPTGSGKTLAFALPIVERTEPADGRPSALVLVPTRELAAQVTDELEPLARARGISVAPAYGGVPLRSQANRIRGAHVLVATPGRLEDLAQRRLVELSGVRTFVLDEADRMLDMGFIHAIKRVRALLPAQRQNLMFSATYSEDIRRLASNLLRNPLAVEVNPPNKTADKVEQISYRLPKEHKRHLLAHLIKEGNWHQVLVFTRTKHGANRLADQLTRAGIVAAPIHGNKSQNARVRA